jgi:hypothetical protein
MKPEPNTGGDVGGIRLFGTVNLSHETCGPPPVYDHPVQEVEGKSHCRLEAYVPATL